MPRKPISMAAIVFLAVVIAFSTPIFIGASPDENTGDISDILPPFEGFRWRVFGIAGYGHSMEIESISLEDDRRVYLISGEVDDMSDGESDADFGLSITYTVYPDVLVQEADGETLLESKFRRLEILREPLVEGNTWEQVVTMGDEEMTLECTIVGVEGTRGERVYEVLYEEKDGDYYERREIEERVGVIHLTRLMRGDEEDYEVSYNLHRPGTGLPAAEQLVDVEPEDWYYPYLGPAVRMDAIRGYPDGSFGANREVSVAEFTRMILSALGHRVSLGEHRWYDPHIILAKDLALLEEGEFAEYNRPMQREEMARMLARAVDEIDTTPVQPTEFEDGDEIDEDLAGYVSEAVSLGLLHGYPDHTFRPREPMTRAEAAKVLSVLMQAVEPAHLDRGEAMALEEEFEDRLFPPTVDAEGTFDRVRDFDRKEDLIAHLSPVADAELAASHVEDYYEERDDGLYLIPRDGPIPLDRDADLDLKLLTPHEIRLVQEGWSGLAGDYELTITYGYRGGRWIMVDRDIDAH